MADYTSQKVAELQDLLKERGLSHTGKKADLIARLQASDAEQSTSGATSAAATAPAESNASATALSTTKASASDALVAAGGKGQPANPLAVPNQKIGEDPAVDKGSTVTGGDTEKKASATNSAAANTTDAVAEAAEPKPDFSAHIPTLTLEEEIEKRRKRAERFGAMVKPASTEATKGDTKTAENGEGSGAKDKATKDPIAEAQRLLERQKRFGGVPAAAENASGVDSLNQALPERARKRGRAGAAGDAVVEGERDGKRRDSRRREGRGGAEQKNKSKPAEAKTAAAAPVKKVSGEQAEKDRLAAEKRRARFGPKTAA